MLFGQYGGMLRMVLFTEGHDLVGKNFAVPFDNRSARVVERRFDPQNQSFTAFRHAMQILLLVLIVVFI